MILTWVLKSTCFLLFFLDEGDGFLFSVWARSKPSIAKKTRFGVIEILLMSGMMTLEYM